MSEHHLELVERICSDWERGDFSRIDWAHPEITFDVPGPDQEKRGVEEMTSAWIGWLGSYRDFRIETTGFWEAGEKVVVDQVFHGEGRSSGIPLDRLVGAAVFTVREGKVVRFRGYRTLAEAMADAGIPEDG